MYCGEEDGRHYEYCMRYGEKKKKPDADKPTSAADAALMSGLVDDTNVRRLLLLFLSPPLHVSFASLNRG
jgi:hypothetical protein